MAPAGPFAAQFAEVKPPSVRQERDLYFPNGRWFYGRRSDPAASVIMAAYRSGTCSRARWPVGRAEPVAWPGPGNQ
jgi:hypothetical protein